MSSYFSTVSPIAYEGPTSDNPLSFKWYDKDRIVLAVPSFVLKLE